MPNGHSPRQNKRPHPFLSEKYIGKDAHNREAWDNDKGRAPKGVSNEVPQHPNPSYWGMPPTVTNILHYHIGGNL